MTITDKIRSLLSKIDKANDKYSMISAVKDIEQLLEVLKEKADNPCYKFSLYCANGDSHNFDGSVQMENGNYYAKCSICHNISCTIHNHTSSIRGNIIHYCSDCKKTQTQMKTPLVA